MIMQHAFLTTTTLKWASRNATVNKHLLNMKCWNIRRLSWIKKTSNEYFKKILHRTNEKIFFNSTEGRINQYAKFRRNFDDSKNWKRNNKLKLRKFISMNFTKWSLYLIKHWNEIINITKVQNSLQSSNLYNEWQILIRLQGCWLPKDDSTYMYI